MNSLPTLPVNALPLADATRQFVPRGLWIDFERADEKCSQFPFELMGADYAARLNKGRGDPRAELDQAARVERDRTWKRIEDTFIGQLVAGSLIMYAQSEPPFGNWRAVAPQSCRGMRIKDLHSGRVAGPNVELFGVYVAEAQAPAAEATPKTTGAPGRPSSMHLVAAEYARRFKAGTTEQNLTEQSKVLAQWLIDTYPDMPSTSAKTIENKLRPDYRRTHPATDLKPPKL
jgi:hypothetical protein